MVVRTTFFAVGLTIAATATPAETMLDRGRYLVEGPAACGNCHTGPVPGTPLFAGFTINEGHWSAHAQNLTPASRIASWSDAELGRAIREGLRPDGSVIGPPMPIHLYRGLSDSDLAAIVAYIRALDPVETAPSENAAYPFPLPPSYGPSIDTVADVSPDNPVAYGAYLAGPVAHCTDCHSIADGRPDLENNLGGGGHVWSGPWGQSVASNITSHADGLAGYSDDEIARMVREGVRPDGSRMMPPMGYGYYAGITDEDMAAIIAFLRTLPPLPDQS